MAHIPYGYRIVDGEGVVDPPEAERVRRFVQFYLEGRSIKAAGALAGIPLCASTLGCMLKNPVYAGDAYYPAILDREIMDKASLERCRRYEALGCFQSRTAEPAIAVRELFRVDERATDDLGALPAAEARTLKTAARKAAWLYARVIADPLGGDRMSSEDRARITAQMTQANLS